MSIYTVVPNEPNKPIEVEKISDIPTWKTDLALLAQLEQQLEEQSKRETRETEKEKIRADEQFLHYFDFGPKLKMQMEKIKQQIDTNCPDGKPIFIRHPDWFSYIKLYTPEERNDLANAVHQREYKRVIILELEQLLKPNPDSLLSIIKDNQEIRRSNLWLMRMVNDLPEIEVIARGEDEPYLDTLELVASNRKSK